MHDVFVVGLDDFNEEQLRRTSRSSDCEFHGLLEVAEVRGLDEFRFEGLLEAARKRLAETGLAPAAICSYWDFPVAEMVPVLAEELGLRSATLESVIRVHHKYWSRVIQAEAVPEATPPFVPVDPFDARAAEVPLDFPFWLKPIRSFRSHLAFLVRDRTELEAALERTRDAIPRLAGPYAEILARVSAPRDDLAHVDGSFCIAEQPISGLQGTAEGYVHGGEPVVYGIVDSIRAPNRSSFLRYQYPSRLPRAVQRRVVRLVTETMRAIDHDGAPFNVEFFWDRRSDRIWLLEVNARQSQSHADLFARVDGAPNHVVMVDLALGDEPSMPSGQGDSRVAAKWFLRAWHDGVVTRVPRPEELADLSASFGCTVRLEVSEGDRLSDLPDQDPYSYELGVVHASAGDQRELIARHRALLELLPLEVVPV